MRAPQIRFVAQLSILIAVVASTALLIDSLGATPAYCSGANGCHAAKLAAREVLGAVPLPLLGLLAFVALLVTTLLAHMRWARHLELAGSLLGALGGIGLLLVQALVLKTFCPFCVVVDVCAVIAGLALVSLRIAADRMDPSQYVHPSATVALCFVAVVAPAAWPHFRPASLVPPQLAEYQVPGRVTVVEFVDLECGHCRALFPTLERLRVEQGDGLHFVRLHVPHRTHRQARSAARLLECLQPDEARIERLATLLFETAQLSRESTVAAAEGVGMSSDELERCWADPASDVSIDRHVGLLDSLGFEGLPTTYVAGERIVGDMPMAVYVAALDRARRASGTSTFEAGAYYVLLAVAVLAILWMGRRGVAHHYTAHSTTSESV